MPQQKQQIASISKEQFQQMVENAPVGFTQRDLLKSLERQGVEVQGLKASSTVDTDSTIGEDRILATKKKPEGERGFSLGRAASNIPSSGGRLLSDLGEAVSHPLRTADALISNIGGAAQAAIPGDFQPRNETQIKNKETFDGLVAYFKERYGSQEDLIRTVEEDPIGFLADASTAVTGAGGAIRGVATVATKGATAARLSSTASAASKLASAGRRIQSVGVSTDPIISAARGTAAVGRRTLRPIARKKVSTAFRPPSKELEAEVRQTLHSQGISPDFADEILSQNVVGTTNQILRRSQKNITKLESEIQAKLKAAPRGTVIETDAIIQALRELKKQVDIPGENASVAAVDTVINDFAQKGDKMTVLEANKLKRDFHEVLNRFYDKNDLPAKREAQMVAARELRAEIGRVVPNVNNLNGQQGLWIRAREMMIDQTVRGLRNNQLSLTDAMIGAGGFAGGASIGGIVGGPIGFMTLVAGRKFLGSTLGKTLSAQGLVFPEVVGEAVAKYLQSLGKAGVTPSTVTRPIEAENQRQLPVNSESRARRLPQ